MADLNTTPDPEKAIDLVAHPLGAEFGAALMVIDRLGSGTWKAISRADAAELAQKLEAYALGE